MEVAANSYENLKTVLKNFRNPGLLDGHPWTKSLIVQERIARDPHARMERPGQQLAQAIAGLFSEMQPPTPPRRGKRLDPRWGEFGLLAALYFTPLRQGLPFPTSLLEAWKRIDSAILYHVYGKPAALLTEEQIQRYRLVGNEVEYGSTSTLSDWHRKGVQRLAEILVNRERFLSSASCVPATVKDPLEIPRALPRASGLRKYSTWLMAAALLFAVLLGVWKGRQVYVRSRAVVEDVTRLQEQVPSLDSGSLDAVTPLLLALDDDLSALQEEAALLLWISPALEWIPVYGGDIASAPDLLGMAGHLAAAADLACQASTPLLRVLSAQGSELNPGGLTALLVAAQPRLAQARLELDQSLDARRKVNVAQLSPRLRDLLTRKVDPLLQEADQGLALAASLPIVLGASSEGPKTYLLLAQNEDELRPTGGFITSVGRLVIQNGQVISLEFEQVDNQEDWSKPYPPAPWQMREYMNSRVMLLRDANWSPDFPTSARLAETLYAYNHSLSVDGVIAFDQQFLVMLLRQLGPLQVEGASELITADNVISYMRSAKERPAGLDRSIDWNRKDFIPRITAAILRKLVAGGDHNWRGIAETLSQALEERHLLLQLDNPQLTSLLASQDWDNSLHPGPADFLMVTDTNMGFNKTNAVVEERLSYTVDLTDISEPQAELTVTHANHASPNVPCIHWNAGQIQDQSAYPIDRCYWSYLRVYKQAGTGLLGAAPMAVPGDWMILGMDIPARVDTLEEDLPGVAGFGTFLVVPGGQTLETRFLFRLPPAVLSQENGTGQVTYRLEVQKQPGTKSIPFDVRVRLPAGATITSAPPGGTAQGSEILLTTGLGTDVEIQVVFQLPENRTKSVP